MYINVQIRYVEEYPLAYEFESHAAFFERHHNMLLNE